MQKATNFSGHAILVDKTKKLSSSLGCLTVSVSQIGSFKRQSWYFPGLIKVLKAGLTKRGPGWGPIKLVGGTIICSSNAVSHVEYDFSSLDQPGPDRLFPLLGLQVPKDWVPINKSYQPFKYPRDSKGKEIIPAQDSSKRPENPPNESDDDDPGITMTSTTD